MFSITTERRDRLIFAFLLLLAGLGTRFFYLAYNKSFISLTKAEHYAHENICSFALSESTNIINNLNKIPIDRSIYLVGCLLKNDSDSKILNEYLVLLNNKIPTMAFKPLWIIDYLAGTLVNLNKDQKAIELYKSYYDYIKSDSTIKEHYASLLLKNNLYQDATNIYIDLISSGKARQTTYESYALILFYTAKYDESINLINTRLDIANLSHNSELILARSLYSKALYAEAIPHYINYFKKINVFVGDFNSNSLEKKLTEKLSAPEELFATNIEVARAMKHLNNFSEATKYYIASTQYKNIPDDISLEIASFLITHNERESAYAVLKSSTLENNEEAKLLLAELEIERHNLNIARDILRSIPKNNEKSYARLATLEFWLKNYQASNLIYSELIKNHPEDKNLHRAYSELLLAMDEKDKAKIELEQSLKGGAEDHE